MTVVSRRSDEWGLCVQADLKRAARLGYFFFW